MDSGTEMPIQEARAIAGELPMAFFRRHLGLPACADLDERSASLAAAAREWYRENGSPWVSLRSVSIPSVSGATVRLSGGVELASRVLAEGLRASGAHALVVAVASAGPEVDGEVQRLWKAGAPDEAMFLNAYGAAAVEHLRAAIGLRLDAAWRGRAIVLPHFSPGYEGWELGDQAVLYGILSGRFAGSSALQGPLEVLPSGALSPSKSTLAVFGLTHSPPEGVRLESLWEDAASRPRRGEGSEETRLYTLSTRALERWSRDRVAVERPGDGRVRAVFRFDGSTCSNMGVPFRFEYRLELEEAADGGWKVSGSSCVPAPGDAGHRAMCAYLAEPDAFLGRVGAERPWIGRRVEELLRARPDASPSGCLCTRAYREHKWRLVLETVHFALAKAEAHPGA